MRIYHICVYFHDQSYYGYYIIINHYCRIFLILSETFDYEYKKNSKQKSKNK